MVRSEFGIRVLLLCLLLLLIGIEGVNGFASRLLSCVCGISRAVAPSRGDALKGKAKVLVPIGPKREII